MSGCMAWAAQSGAGRLRLAAGQVISLMNRQAAAEPGEVPEPEVRRKRRPQGIDLAQSD